MIGDEQAGIIGLYGMGGVGKTTLLTQLNNQLCKSSTHGFDVVIWIVVSKTKNYEKVQDGIGEKIGLYDDMWRNKSQENKAMDIFRDLRKKKFALFLDDIWERFDLTKVGIRLPIQSNKSKVVITTRSKDVCGQMGAHKNIEVKCLTEEDALNLSREKVGDDTLNAHSKIRKLAEVVAKKCGGLPLALITIGRAMACKTKPQEWLHAIRVLKSCASKFPGMGDEVLPLLKFSYDSLQRVAVQSCFLYRSLYPEDYLILKEELEDLWICEGFLDEFDDFNAARNLAHDIIGTLVRASLLEEDSDYYVKMHDVIRDMALWISDECGATNDRLFVQVGVGLTETPKYVKWEEVERMSLMNNQIVELTGTPECTNLLTLFLQRNKLEMINSGFLQTMPTLRVLDLSENEIYRLPKEICELVSLQYLNLSHTSLEELPIEFKNLVNLKYLNLTYSNIHIIPEGIFSNLMKLQVLEMFQCSPSSDVVEILVKELESLNYLNRLGISIKTTSTLSHLLCCPKLLTATTRLELGNFKESKYMDVSFLQNMTYLDRLDINDCKELEELIVQWKRKEPISKSISHDRCFLSLSTLVISECPMLKYLTWITFAPSLSYLHIFSCRGMEALIGGGDARDGCAEGLFSKLEYLNLTRIPNLESISPNALPFPCLKDLRIYFCSKLKKLPINSNTAKGFQIWGTNEWWNKLEWEDEATQECFSSSFKAVG